jgi:hypothetical protein
VINKVNNFCKGYKEAKRLNYDSGYEAILRRMELSLNELQNVNLPWGSG